jgi:hypothetical protein
LTFVQDCSVAAPAHTNISPHQHLQLPQGFPVILASTSSDIAAAARCFCDESGVVSVPAVSIDVEWPCDAWEGDGRASIMQVRGPCEQERKGCNAGQVGCVNGCVVFDLLAVCSSDASTLAFSDLLLRLFSSNCTKVFYGYHQDMLKLRCSWPAVSAFTANMTRCLELNQLAAAVRSDMRNKSLSDVCSCFLGQSLDKNQRLSNWMLRPLAPEQVAYAALDVYAPILLLDHLRASCHSADTPHGEWFESLYFNLCSADYKVSPMNAEPQRIPVEVCESAHNCLNDCSDSADICSPLALPVECIDQAEAPHPASEEAANSRAGEVGAQGSVSASCDGRGMMDVAAVLDQHGLKASCEFLRISSDDSTCGQMVSSKFEVFDRIQMHAEAVGMTRRQVFA